MLKKMTLATALLALASPAFAQDCSDPALAGTAACTGFDFGEFSTLTGPELYAAGLFAAAAAVGFFGADDDSTTATATTDTSS